MPRRRRRRRNCATSRLCSAKKRSSFVLRSGRAAGAWNGDPSWAFRPMWSHARRGRPISSSSAMLARAETRFALSIPAASSSRPAGRFWSCFNSFPFVEEGKMLGIVTKFDFLRAFAFTTGQMVPHYDELMKRPVAEVMTEAVVHVEPTAPLTRVLQLMVSLKARSFPVVGAERQLVGIISREDVMRALRDATREAR